MAAVGVIGSGTWGTALAILLEGNGHQVDLWSAIPEEAKMLTLNKIREDLKEIRYYYSRKAMFDECKNIVIGSSIMEKVRRYNEAVKTAPPRLYDTYMMLYVKGYTQEALSAELNYTPVYIQMLNKQLLLFLQSKLTD